MSDQPDLFPETVKRPRGRPKKPHALSGAERMRRMREQAKTVLWGAEAETNGRTLADLSDTALVDLVREPLKHGQVFTLMGLVTELMRRANARQEPGSEPMRLARWIGGERGEWFEITRQVTENVGESSVQNPSGDKKKKGQTSAYSPHVKAMAVRMKNADERHVDIIAAIHNECGKAPDKTNIKRFLERWRQDPDVIAILDNP